MNTLTQERFPWTEYAELQRRAESICRDRDKKGRNHAKPLLETYTVAQLVAQLQQRVSRLEGGIAAVQLTPDATAREQIVQTVVEDCIDLANYAFFMAMKAQYERTVGGWTT